MADKLELKSSHEVIYTVDVADVEYIFYCKPTDPDILTVLMKDGKRLYCDEVCPVQEEPVSEGLQTEIEDYVNRNFSEGSDGCLISDKNKSLGGVTYSEICELARHFANWQKQQMMKDAVDIEYDNLVAYDIIYKICQVLGEKGKGKMIIVKQEKE